MSTSPLHIELQIPRNELVALISDKPDGRHPRKESSTANLKVTFDPGQQTFIVKHPLRKIFPYDFRLSPGRRSHGAITKLLLTSLNQEQVPRYDSEERQALRSALENIAEKAESVRLTLTSNAALRREDFELVAVTGEYTEEHYPHLRARVRIAKESVVVSDITPFEYQFVEKAAATKAQEIGEIVLIAPEGPHAIAGGLARVIQGLLTICPAQRIPTTLIAPLYEWENGSKHTSADATLSEGVPVGNRRLFPKQIGSINVDIGPTRVHGTEWNRRQPSSVSVDVYRVTDGLTSLYLLRNGEVFDQVYRPVWGDEQLRRSLVLSRASLNLIASDLCQINPSIIISNDWHTALVPALAKLDLRYSCNEKISRAVTLHTLHNAGADYHGRLPTQFGEEELWTMLNLDGTHFFGLRDRWNSDLLNLTLGAVRHASGVLTVSPAYAQQLKQFGGSEGLEEAILDPNVKVYGISNGIDRSSIDNILVSIGEASKAASEIEQEDGEDVFFHRKRATKSFVQQRFGLTNDSGAVLISFVGRLAEQKGLQLITGWDHQNGCSCLEAMLKLYPNSQFIIGGPATAGDTTVGALGHLYNYLSCRYPGRLAVMFDFIPHETALEIIHGSDLLLMPSRFEPGGITQLEAMASGTPVVARNVGGISSTVQNFNSENGEGTGFLFDDFTPEALRGTLTWAIDTMRDAELRAQIISACRQVRSDWSDRMPNYISLFRELLRNNLH